MSVNGEGRVPNRDFLQILRDLREKNTLRSAHEPITVRQKVKKIAV
jgi:hypothetical protein